MSPQSHVNPQLPAQLPECSCQSSRTDVPNMSELCRCGASIRLLLLQLRPPQSCTNIYTAAIFKGLTKPVNLTAAFMSYLQHVCMCVCVRACPWPQHTCSTMFM